MADYINADISYIKESDAYSGADASHYKESHDYINADIRYIKETDVYIFRDLSHIKEIESYRHADGACRQTMAGGSEEMAGYISADAPCKRENGECKLNCVNGLLKKIITESVNIFV